MEGTRTRARTLLAPSRDASRQCSPQVQLFPESGSEYLFGTSRLLLRPLPYQLVYAFRDGVIRIIALAHTSREPGYWASRLD